MASPIRQHTTDGDRDALAAIAEAIAGDEDRFVERLYERFFTRAPEARALFGEHSLSEQNEMVAETFRSIVAWADREEWLETNLVALGESHLEYGVEANMYPPFVEAFLETTARFLDDSVSAQTLERLRAGLEAVATGMSEAGEARLARDAGGAPPQVGNEVAAR